MPDTFTEAHTALDVADDARRQGGQDAQDRLRPRWWAWVARSPEGERWLVVGTAQGEERARTTFAWQVKTEWRMKVMAHVLLLRL